MGLVHWCTIPVPHAHRAVVRLPSYTNQQRACQLLLTVFVVMQMRHPGRTLVFVNAISMTLRVSKILTHLSVPTIALHAGQQQRQRLKVKTSPPPPPPSLRAQALRPPSAGPLTSPLCLIQFDGNFRHAGNRHHNDGQCADMLRQLVQPYLRPLTMYITTAEL